VSARTAGWSAWSPDYPNLADFGRPLEHQQGRIRSHFPTGGAADLGNFFGYDKLDRIQADTFAMVEKDLCSWDADQGWVCPAPTVDSVHVYSYDGAGNRTDLSGSYTTGNRITAFNGCSYGTDTTGSVTSRTCGSQTVRFHWTAENWLKALKVVGGDSLDFRYDATGRLVRRDLNGSVQRYFLWPGDALFAELNASGVDQVEYYYPGLDRPHALGLAGDTVYFAHFDGLGNVIGHVKQNNWLAAGYDYDLWGQAELTSESLQGQTNRARFKGALWMAGGMSSTRLRWWLTSVALDGWVRCVPARARRDARRGLWGQWVSLILDFLAGGMTVEQILAEYPDLTPEDIRACIAYGAEMARERYVDLSGAGA